MQFDKKKILFSLALFTLMMVKVSAFHVYMHDDASKAEIENCSTCDLAIEQQQTEFVSIDFPVEINTPLTNSPLVTQNFNSVFLLLEKQLSYYHQNRPPPALLD